MRIEEQLKISKLKKRFEKKVCSEFFNAFEERKRHSISLPYEEGFIDKKIPTRARPIVKWTNNILITAKKKEEIFG